jgi:hypothetical protein
MAPLGCYSDHSNMRFATIRIGSPAVENHTEKVGAACNQPDQVGRAGN